RYDLRGRAAPLRGILVGVRPPVPRPAGAARRRLDRRIVTCYFHRTENGFKEPSIDGGDCHGNLRLLAIAVFIGWCSALLQLRQTHLETDAGPDCPTFESVARGRARDDPGADRARPKGRVQETITWTREVRICAGACGWRAAQSR